MENMTDFEGKVEVLCGEIEKGILGNILYEGFEAAEEKSKHLVRWLKHHVDNYDYNEYLNPNVELALRRAAIALGLPTIEVRACSLEPVERRHITACRVRLEDIDSDRKLLSILLGLNQVVWDEIKSGLLAQVA